MIRATSGPGSPLSTRRPGRFPSAAAVTATPARHLLRIDEDWHGAGRARNDRGRVRRGARRQPGPAHAEQKPLWEAGLGVGAATFPDHPGSDRTQTYVLPAPYFVYRGEFLKADRDGLRGRFFNSDRIELNLTMGASAPVDSTDNAARQGMPDLNPPSRSGRRST